jgi:hypothetical protein
MAQVVISSLATMMVQVPVQARLNGAAVYNPTADLVYFAFVAGFGKPGSGDWHPGSWATDPGPEYLAQCLIGPAAGVVLPVGSYVVWVRIVDAPEVPVLQVGQLVIE